MSDSRQPNCYQLDSVHDIVSRHTALGCESEALIVGERRLNNHQLQSGALMRLPARCLRMPCYLVIVPPPLRPPVLIFPATTSIGAIWQKLNPEYQRNEYASFLEDATPKVVLCFRF